MDTSDLLKLAGQGGISLIILGAFIWLIRTVGVALVTAMREMTKAITEHTKVDIEFHQEVLQDLAELRGHITGVASERSKPVRKQHPQEVPILPFKKKRGDTEH